jgi:hypothetical protein
MIRQAIEGRTTWFHDLRPTDLPHSLPSGITIHLRGEELGLEVQGLAGAIPLLNKDTLQIIPKIGRVNFLRLLFKAEGFQRDLGREYEDFVAYSVDDEQNVDAIVTRQLFLSAAEIMKRSPQTTRIKRRREGVFALGQLDAVKTAFNLAQRKQEPVAYFLPEKSVDISENRILTEALIRAQMFLSQADLENLRWIADKWFGRFPRSDDVQSDLLVIEEGFAAGKYGGARDYYRKALMLAKVVLGSNGLSFGESITIEGDAVLLNTADVFEKYLRAVISDAYSEAGFVVTKGGVGVSSLYTDGSFELEPDIVVSRNGKTLLIADAKYKVPTSGDHYQMHTYLNINGVDRGLLLSPRYDGDEVVVREYATANKVVVREVYLPMRNLALTEEFLVTVIEQFA